MILNIWIILVITFSSLIKGITGFGFALISLPVLLIWYPAKEIVPVLMICNLIASLLIILQKKEHKLLDKQSTLLMVAGGFFTIIGVIALSKTDGKMILQFAGVFFIALTLFSLIKSKTKDGSLPNYSYLVAGGIIGFLTGSISVSGPPLALFLNRANVSNRKFREIFAWFSVITATIAIIGYYHAGLITPQTIKTSLVFTPILLIGTIVGKKTNTVMSIKSFKYTNIILTLIASVLLIINK